MRIFWYKNYVVWMNIEMTAIDVVPNLLFFFCQSLVFYYNYSKKTGHSSSHHINFLTIIE
jgi:hypothetical protein